MAEQSKGGRPAGATDKPHTPGPRAVNKALRDVERRAKAGEPADQRVLVQYVAA
jgi:hypothetical protein